MKKLVALLLSMLMLTAMIPAMAETADDMIIVYAKVPADWAFPCIWAWASDGTNAFASWPGDMMEPDAKNDGWYYIYVPTTMESVIINASDASVQTDEVKISLQRQPIGSCSLRIFLLTQRSFNLISLRSCAAYSIHWIKTAMI